MIATKTLGAPLDRRARRLFFVCLAISAMGLVLAGCVSAPTRPPSADAAAEWVQRQIELGPLTRWELNGRVAMRAADEGWQGSVRWVREGERNVINLAGPFGGGGVRITQDQNGAELRDGEKNTYRAENARALLYRTTGWDMPIDGLKYWVRGLPQPRAAGAERLDAWGRLTHLRQLDWEVEFLEYARVGRYELPSKLFLKRRADEDAEPAAHHAREPVELRLIINRWDLK